MLANFKKSSVIQKKSVMHKAAFLCTCNKLCIRHTVFAVLSCGNNSGFPMNTKRISFLSL